MAAEAKFLAYDLGAESGRAVVGLFDGERIRLEDVHRFQSRSVRLLDTLTWDAPGLFAELKHGLSMAVSAHGRELAGIGIDTWGVDFGLLGRDDVLLGNPRHYRDHGNDGMLEAAFEIMPQAEIFRRTGIQFMQINTLFQLLALKRMRSPLLDCAQTLLMMPDLLGFWFTGIKATEYSIASTSQMLDAGARTWDRSLMEAFGLPTDILTDIVMPGTVLGPLRADIAAESGCGAVPVISPPEHDTASAVVAAPAEGEDYAYLSSGTWSLLGVELTEPRIDAGTAAANFTNEGGADGTIRLLKNIMGLWLVQECRRSWARQGEQHSYAELTAKAATAAPFGLILNPDDPTFLAPTDMVAAIRAFATRTGQTPPMDQGAVVRACLEGLALRYRWALEKLEQFRGRRIDTLHIVGGGTQNRLLSQFAANATGRRVIAGPVEATAIGNVLMQARGVGLIGSLAEARAIVRRSFDLETYEPQDQDAWQAAYGRFLELL